MSLPDSQYIILDKTYFFIRKKPLYIKFARMFFVILFYFFVFELGKCNTRRRICGRRKVV